MSTEEGRARTHTCTQQLMRYGSQLNSLPNYGLPTRVILMQWCDAYRVLNFWWVSNIGHTDSFKEQQDQRTYNLTGWSKTDTGCVRQLGFSAQSWMMKYRPQLTTEVSISSLCASITISTLISVSSHSGHRCLNIICVFWCLYRLADFRSPIRILVLL